MEICARTYVARALLTMLFNPVVYEDVKSSSVAILELLLRGMEVNGSTTQRGCWVGGEQQGGAILSHSLKQTPYLFVHLIVDFAQNSWTNGDNDWTKRDKIVYVSRN